jgi:putative Holliday junction resolvase
MAILGLDVGDKRTGVAIAHGLIAVPLTVIESEGEEADLERIAAMANEYGVERIVVGLPKSLDGSTGKQAEKVMSFVRELSEHIDIPIDTWDERFSTVTAERMLRDAGKRREDLKANRDASAAAVMLQAYLDRTGT